MMSKGIGSYIKILTQIKDFEFLYLLKYKNKYEIETTSFRTYT